MDKMSPRVYIIILNYKNWQDTLECLESVFSLRYDNFSVIVVDNDSRNESMNRLRAWADAKPGASGPASYEFYRSGELPSSLPARSLPPLVFIQHDHNAGFAGGNNVAIRLLTGNEGYIWLLNPDIVVEQDMLDRLVRFAGNFPDETIIGSVLKFYDQRDRIHYYGGGRVRFASATVSLIATKEDIPRLDYVSGGSLMTKASNFSRLGLLPDEYFLYWEETDWCFRAQQAGFELAVCLEAVCYDKGGTSIGRGSQAEFFYTRNGLLFVSRYKRGKIVSALLFTGIRLLRRILTGQWDKATGMWKGMVAFLKKMAV
jgi:GT2 family glycosyltransferase